MPSWGSRSPFSWLSTLVALLIPFGANAQLAPPEAIVYRLLPESALLQGCFDPCDCLLQITEDLQGTFALQRVVPQPLPGLYDVYAVSDVSFFAKRLGETLHITGSGVYRVGGEVALLQQLTLDLRFGDQPPQRFDSGLQPGVKFPRIDLDVSMNGKVCYDTVLQLRAEPVPPGDADGDGVPDDRDDCPHAFDPDQADADKNGIGDACECGDQNGDGTVNVADLTAMNAAIFGLVPVSPLCDTNYDGLCNVRDIIGANLKIYGKPAYCRAYPPPGP